MLTGTDPASPANDNDPQVQGTVGSCGSPTDVDVYANASCSGSPAATGTVAQFTGAGIGVSVADNSVTSLSAKAKNGTGDSACSNSISYTEDSQAPGAPTISDTDPDSPANANTPSVKGSGAESGSTVRLYGDASCSGAELGSGSSAAFNGSGGITATVPDNQTTNLRATATDAAGNASPCSGAFAYTEDSQAPGAPSITDTDPDSPADENSPEVKGSAEAGSTVKVFQSNNCSGGIEVQGPAASFAAPGLTASVTDDATHQFTATATDAAGNASPCSGALSYTEDSASPSATISFPAGGSVHTSASYAAGCADAVPNVCGTASDGGGSGVDGVEVRIRRQSDSQYWNGTGWQPGELWLPATGSTSWSFGFAPGEDTYTQSARATDGVAHVGNPATVTFTINDSAPADQDGDGTPDISRQLPGARQP